MINRIHTNAMFTCLALILSACASTPSNNNAASSGAKNTIEQAMLQEAALSDSYQLDSEDGFFSATVKGAKQPSIQPLDGLHQVTIPIGTRIPAQCFVYHDALDSATTLNYLIDASLETMEKTKISNIDAGTFDKMPFLYKENLYFTKDNKVGMLKGIVVPLKSSLLACLHDTVGYRETFRQMVESFAMSLTLKDVADENWNHEEVIVWRMRDMNIGYTVTRATPSKDGEIKSITETALMIPRSEQETLTHDEYNLTYEHENGELIYGRYSEAENGELKINVRLDLDEQGDYRVSGTFKGKQIDEPLNADAVLEGPYHQRREIIHAAKPDDGKPQAVRINGYIPSANPLESMAMEMTPTGEHVDGLPQYEMMFSGMKATALVDDLGHKSMMLEMGQIQLQLSRAYITQQ